MPRPPNSGRKKGSKNIRKVAKVSDILAERGLNPAEEILRILEQEDLKPSEQIDAWLDLLSYCQAKPKEVEEDFDDGPDEDLEDTPKEQLLKLVKNNGKS
jgi:hypothetical protein